MIRVCGAGLMVQCGVMRTGAATTLTMLPEYRTVLECILLETGMIQTQPLLPLHMFVSSTLMKDVPMMRMLTCSCKKKTQGPPSLTGPGASDMKEMYPTLLVGLTTQKCHMGIYQE